VKEFVCSENDPREAYRLLIGIIGPRPIGWISTISKEGIPNLAPYSFFNMFSMNPPVLGFSAALNREAKDKDSLRNVRETECFVHHLVTEDLCEKMNQSSAEYPAGISEFEKVGLTPIPSDLVLAPRVLEAAISVECRLQQIVSLGNKPGNGQLALGEVLKIHFHRPDLLGPDQLLDETKVSYISRLGKTNYMKAGEIFSSPRPVL
jgi:flavin reductase (DIM6/NTAB) family NADH-FMN oxidoreductase RutF